MSESEEDKTIDGLEDARRAINDIDRRMAALFCERMEAVQRIASYKAKNGLPIYDRQRERQVIDANAARVSQHLRPYYVRFLENTMDVSKSYQLDLIENPNED